MKNRSFFFASQLFFHPPFWKPSWPLFLLRKKAYFLSGLSSLKLTVRTWKLKMDGWKSSFVLGNPVFKGYVSFLSGVTPPTLLATSCSEDPFWQSMITWESNGCVSRVSSVLLWKTRCVFAKSEIWENNLHPGRFTAGSPTNHQFFRKELWSSRIPMDYVPAIHLIKGCCTSRISSSISMESWSSTSIGFIGFFHIYLHARKRGQIIPDPTDPNLGEFVACKILDDDAPKWCMTPPNLQAKNTENIKIGSHEVVKSPGFLATNLKII